MTSDGTENHHPQEVFVTEELQKIVTWLATRKWVNERDLLRYLKGYSGTPYDTWCLISCLEDKGLLGAKSRRWWGVKMHPVIVTAQTIPQTILDYPLHLGKSESCSICGGTDFMTPTDACPKCRKGKMVEDEKMKVRYS